MRKIQVVGTNGKGSVCTYLANILTAAGYKTGLYTSPHVQKKEERIAIDGVQISQQEFDRLLGGKEPEKHVFLRYTEACMQYFEEQGVEIAVLETGLGGRLDPVSRYKMDETVITTIDLDHMQVLGDTIEQITMEKCATIGYQGYVVSMPQQPSVRKIIEVTSQLQNARLIFSEPEEILWHEDGTFDYQEYTGLETKMLGKMQPLNAATAAIAARALSHVGIFITPEHVRRGIANTAIPARQQYLKEQDMLVDGAHNEGALRELWATLDAQFADRKLVLLAAAMAEKDVSVLIEMAQKRGAQVVATQVQDPRARSAQSLAALFPGGQAQPDLSAALELARRKAKESGALLVVAGSFYLAGEVLDRVGI